MNEFMKNYMIKKIIIMVKVGKIILERSFWLNRLNL